VEKTVFQYGIFVVASLGLFQVLRHSVLERNEGHELDVSVIPDQLSILYFGEGEIDVLVTLVTEQQAVPQGTVQSVNRVDAIVIQGKFTKPLSIVLQPLQIKLHLLLLQDHREGNVVGLKVGVVS
jgi:hypothetical protein